MARYAGDNDEEKNTFLNELLQMENYIKKISEKLFLEYEI